MSPHAAYRHSQIYTMLWIILLAMGAFGGFMLAIDDHDDALAGGAVLVLCLGGGLLILGRLVIEVRTDAVHWQFGYVGWPTWSVPISAIARVESTRCPVSHGSGIRGSRQHRQYNVTMGGPALRLHLYDGRTITLGTPEPQRLAGFIESRRGAAPR